jgi:hypothetical protein
MPEEQWEEVQGEQGKLIRWNEEPENAAQKEKTIFVGTEIMGIYEDKRENVGENAANIYNIRTAEHGLLSVWGTTVLDDKFESIAVSSEVKIVMTGKQKPKNGGKAYFCFTVSKRPGPMVEVKPEEDRKEIDM